MGDVGGEVVSAGIPFSPDGIVPRDECKGSPVECDRGLFIGDRPTLVHGSFQEETIECGTRLAEEELRAGLLESLNSTGSRFKLAESRKTDIKNGQRRIFQPVPAAASVEYDFRFRFA